jgi:hypothetical protein
VKGHGFSRAETANQPFRALAPEGMREEATLRTTSATDKTFVRPLAHEKQRRKKSLTVIAFVPLLLGLLVGWYVVAADYSYRAVAGTYKLETNNASSTLVLREDQTFEETLDEHGLQKISQGTWRRIGEGGIVFSNTFLSTPGREAQTDGEVFGEVEKAFGLFISIHIHHSPNEPVYRRHFLS